VLSFSLRGGESFSTCVVLPRGSCTDLKAGADVHSGVRLALARELCDSCGAKSGLWIICFEICAVLSLPFYGFAICNFILACATSISFNMLPFFFARTICYLNAYQKKNCCLNGVFGFEGVRIVLIRHGMSHATIYRGTSRLWKSTSPQRYARHSDYGWNDTVTRTKERIGMDILSPFQIIDVSINLDI
jgi:hypothetical protein